MELSIGMLVATPYINNASYYLLGMIIDYIIADGTQCYTIEWYDFQREWTFKDTDDPMILDGYLMEDVVKYRQTYLEYTKHIRNS